MNEGLYSECVRDLSTIKYFHNKNPYLLTKRLIKVKMQLPVS
jgi:hypothetical protein